MFPGIDLRSLPPPRFRAKGCGGQKNNEPHHCGPSVSRCRPDAAYFSFAAFFSASALSVFSHEKAVAVCFLPAPSV